MECNKDEARRAMDIAEKKLSENDYNGAKTFVNKAQNLYPELDGIKQVLMMINVYISAAANYRVNGSGRGEADWYGILGVDPLADDEAVKKQYKKLALLLHPDKNKFKGAEDAFKLVSQAWSLLSDKVKRASYDLRRKLNEAKTRMQKPPNPFKPASSKWKICNRCKTQCAVREYGHYMKILCQRCGQVFVATKDGKPVNLSYFAQQQQQQWRAQNKATNNSTNFGGSSGGKDSFSSASAAQKPPQATAKSQETNKKNTYGTSSSGRVSSPSVSFSYSYQWSCSVSLTANQAQELSKRVYEQSQETVASVEKLLKKPRTGVR